MKSVVLCLAVALVSRPIAAEAQSPSQVLERYLTAIGGKKAVERIVSAEVRGSVESADGRTGVFTQTTKRPQLISISLSWGDLRWRAGFNGRAAWQEDGIGELRTLYGQPASALRAEGLYASTRFAASDKVVQVLAAGRGQVRERPAVLVIAITPDGAKRTLFFDAANYLLLKDEREMDGGVEERFFDDYRRVDQVLVPHRIEWRRNGETLRIAVERVTHNGPLDERVFDAPADPTAAPVDRDAVLAAAQRNEVDAENARASYTYDMVARSGRMDAQGVVAPEETAAYEIFHLGGLQVRKLLRSRGKPLSDAERRREDERVNGVLEAFRKGTMARPAVAPRSDGLTLYMLQGASAFSALVRMSEFSGARREQLRGRAMVVVEFQPRRGVAPRNLLERQISRMAGAVWIDETSHHLALVESYFRDDHERTIQGSSIRMERTLFNDEVWLPSRDELQQRWSFAFGNRSQWQSTSIFSGHRKFGVDTDAGFRLPEPPPR